MAPDGSSGGGGISGDTVSLTNSTVYDNYARGRSGYSIFRSGSGIRGSDITIINSIVANNSSSQGFYSDVYSRGGELVVDASLIGDTNNTGITATTGTGNILSQSAMLGPLEDNGGPTLTHAPLPASPVIDAGNNALAVDAAGVTLNSDQRGSGFSRIFGTSVDIGAFEARPTTPIVTNTNDVVNADTSSVSALLADDGGDGISLREAIESSNNTVGDDMVTFDGSVFTGGAASVVRLTQGELTITDALTIDGSSANNLVITGDANGDDSVSSSYITRVGASGNNLLDDNSRVINSSATLNLANLTVTGGRALRSNEGGGGIRTSTADVFLTNVTVSGNSTYATSYFYNTNGGGIYSESGSVHLLNSTVSGNSASVLAFTGGGSSGGGIHSESGNVYLTNSSVSGNTAEGSGSSSGSGGGISTGSGNVSLISSTISGNRVFGDFSSGGGIATSSGTVSLTNSTLRNNRVSGGSYQSSGGGISSGSGGVSLLYSTISNNSVGNYSASGGGISSSGIVSVINSTISGNSALPSTPGFEFPGSAQGGGINAGTVSLINSTLYGNSAGVYRYGSGYEERGSAISSSRPTIINSIVEGTIRGSASVVEFSLIVNTTGSDITTTTGTGNILNQPAMLGPLEDNGGPTLTHAPLSNSPVIDAGNNVLAADAAGVPLSNDQRGSGFFRTFGTSVDIGAIEDQPPNPVINNTNDVVNADTSSISALLADDGGDGISLREAILASNNTPGLDAITFDASVFNGGTASLIRLTQGELLISEELTIDGSSATDLVISGDASGNDVTVDDTFVTDVDASLSANASLLDDNLRVINFASASGTLSLSNLTVTGGRTTGTGGGITTSSGDILLVNSSLKGNSTTGNSADGGGIHSDSGDVSLTNSTVSGNRTDGNGSDGGGVITFSGNVSLTNSTVSGNITGGDNSEGGGIYTFSGDITLNTSTLSGNSTRGSSSEGGGIITGNGNISLSNSTVTGNSAALAAGGGIYVLETSTASRFSVVNSILAGNSSNGSAPDASPDSTSSLVITSSLIGNTSGSGITAKTGTGNILNQQARLGPLADNGGPTLTHALLPSSPAFNAGNNALALDENGNPLTTDQRGENRIRFGTVDIGAVESEFDDPFLLGDTSLDGAVNFFDITPFISLLANGTFLNEGDINRDGNVDFLDINPFISLLASGNQSNVTSSPAVENSKSPPITTASVLSPEKIVDDPLGSSSISLAPATQPKTITLVPATNATEVSITPDTSETKQGATDTLTSTCIRKRYS